MIDTTLVGSWPFRRKPRSRVREQSTTTNIAQPGITFVYRNALRIVMGAERGQSRERHSSSYCQLDGSGIMKTIGRGALKNDMQLNCVGLVGHTGVLASAVACSLKWQKARS